MSRLSNFFRPRDPNQPSGGADPVHRPVRRPEIESALRLILANQRGPATDEAVLEFLGFALERKIDVNQIWVAKWHGRVAWALLPITSPGRTMLLFTPCRLPPTTPPDVARGLTEAVCAHWRGQQMQLAQFLLDPGDVVVRDLYLSCGFNVLAELIYLHRGVEQAPAGNGLPAGFEIRVYSPETHDAFAAAILRSYEGSLDCPALNGKRSIADVIEGHKASGGFEPSMWHLLLENGASRGVLILSPSQQNDTVELVYLGLVPEARNRGLGDAMMRLALSGTAGINRRALSLAVDSANVPALKLYYRHGMQRIGSRLAMVRELRP